MIAATMPATESPHQDQIVTTSRYTTPARRPDTQTNRRREQPPLTDRTSPAFTRYRLQHARSIDVSRTFGDAENENCSVLDSNRPEAVLSSGRRSEKPPSANSVHNACRRRCFAIYDDAPGRGLQHRTATCGAARLAIGKARGGSR